MQQVQDYYAAYAHCGQCVEYYGAVYQKAPAAQAGIGDEEEEE